MKGMKGYVGLCRVYILFHMKNEKVKIYKEGRKAVKPYITIHVKNRR